MREGVAVSGPVGSKAIEGEARTLFDGLARGNWHRPGEIRTLRLHRVEDAFFSRLVSEVLQLVHEEAPADITEVRDLANLVRPTGTAVRFSLLNTSGDFNDTDDVVRSIRGKRFHHGDRFPTLAEFIGALPDALNVRVLSLEPSSGLGAHEVNVVHPSKTGDWFRGRFHLPIVTNPRAEVMLDGHHFHYEPGIIYFFNNGCIHSASNGGDEVRYHIVWDMAFTEASYEAMFSDAEPRPQFLKRITGAERVMAPIRTSRIGAYETTGPGAKRYKQLRLGSLGIKLYQFLKLYNRFAFIRFRQRGNPTYARLD